MFGTRCRLHDLDGDDRGSRTFRHRSQWVISSQRSTTSSASSTSSSARLDHRSELSFACGRFACPSRHADPGHLRIEERELRARPSAARPRAGDAIACQTRLRAAVEPERSAVEALRDGDRSRGRNPSARNLDLGVIDRDEFCMGRWWNPEEGDPQTWPGRLVRDEADPNPHQPARAGLSAESSVTAATLHAVHAAVHAHERPRRTAESKVDRKLPNPRFGLSERPLLFRVRRRTTWRG